MNQDNRRNYYRLLHVQPDAPTEIIKSSYRTLMQSLRMHPDLGGDHWNASLLNEAYAVLSDADKRAAYDAGRDALPRSDDSANSTGAADATASNRARRGSTAFCPFCHADIDGRIESDSNCNRCTSPLVRAETFSRRADWLRTVERVPKAVDLRIWTDWPQDPEPASLLDLSLTGLRFSFSRGLPVGSFIKLDCELFTSVARVVRCQADGQRWQLGAEFYTLRFLRSRGGFVSAEA
jgi:curved DNA-binding protein CbpA